MPANEQTWRDIPLLHRVFAVSGLLMLLSTVWVFWNDQRREWRQTQAHVVNIDTTMNQWRQQQFETDTATSEHETKAERKLLADAEPIDPGLLDQFAAEVERFNANMEALGDSARLHYDADIAQRQQQQAELAQVAADAWSAAEQAEAEAEAKKAAYLEQRSAAKSEGDETVEAAAKEASAAQEQALTLRNAANQAALESARQREQIVADLNALVTQVRNRENVALGERKFKSADLDAAKANIDIGVRDNVGRPRMQELEGEVTRIQEELNVLNRNYQLKNESRVALQKIVARITERQVEADKEYKDALADLEALRKAFEQRKETWFVSSPPFLGKRILNLPILNAFNAPQKIENLWSAGLEQNYNHRMVRRFDRCTTCHQLMQRTIPNQPQDPAFVHERDLVMVLEPPETLVPPAEENVTQVERLEKTFGLRLAEEGIVNFDDVTVSLVLPGSAAAKAEVQSDERTQPLEAGQLRRNVAQFTSAETEAINYKVLPGLLPGDVITEIEGSKVTYSPERVAATLLDTVGAGQPLRITVRRGLANPFTTHPRLDLFVGDNSPHSMGTFGCTICHEGQGNATAFKWASHTPDDSEADLGQSERWAREYGWFDNHHWIYPMFPKRFAESGCLKCHHDVVELEPSEKFPDPPAPKVTHGYHLIRKFGCYGCHDVNGYDGPDKRIGPDLRTEPNFFAAALQLGHLLPSRLTDLEQLLEQTKSEYETLHENEAELSTEDQKRHAELAADVAQLQSHVEKLTRALELAPEVARRNFDKASRNELFQLFALDAAIQSADKRAFTPEMHRTAGVLKDVEAPGQLRKPGPTLRYVNEKLDRVFLYDWTANPRNFRPTTRMPRFFGLWEHLHAEPASLQQSQQLEPVEIHGIVSYLEQTSQQFVPLEKPEGIAETTIEASRERGKVLFETRGCLACHEHHDFPQAKAYRGDTEIVQGPELSGLAQKFDEQRNPKGHEWLYSWIKDPTRYNVRTLMPNLYLDPIESKDAEGNTITTDPVADIVAYLTDPSHVARAQETGDDAGAAAAHDHEPWEPVAEAEQEVDREMLRKLVQEYLRESFHESRLDEYYENGLPERMRGELKVAEQDLVVAEGEPLTDEQRLRYVGRKTISKFGCYGCHDIAGFEDAKPIGTGLADWGRKDPSRLAFEHIGHFLHPGHGSPAAEESAEGSKLGEHGMPVARSSEEEGVDPHVEHAAKGETAHADHDAHASHDAHADALPVFYERAISHGHRSGFIYQKLRGPRTYDYMKTQNKKYNDRLRMPEFPFKDAEREAVITFVLGLVAEPPTEKYVYKADEQRAALIAGKQVLETYNCGGCHILDGERWRLSFAPETFGEPSLPKTFPFLIHSAEPGELAKSATPDRRGMVQGEVMGLPSLEATGDNGALPVIRDPDGADFEDTEQTTRRAAMYEFMLYSPAALAGHTFQPGARLEIPGSTVVRKYPAQGGYLTRYLSPVVFDLERQTNPNAKGNEVYGWLPPPLMGEGQKVQTDWLYDFLLEPYAIRPATFLRMPKFNLSPEDATKLVNYFAIRDGEAGPYEFDPRRQADHLASAQARYQRQAEEANAAEGEQDRFESAMKTVTNRTYCVQCHSVADFKSDNTPRAQGPDLAQVYRRLRPDYTRRWIAYPQMILPYTPMPENIKYDPTVEQLSDKWYHGSRVEQLDGLVDLLMNFDEYAKRNTNIADLVPPPPKEQPAEAATGAEAESE